MTSECRNRSGVSRPWYLLVPVLLFTILVGSSRAVDWPSITPEQQNLQDLKEMPGASAVILERQEIADDTNNVHSTYKRIKILTEAGRKYADVELPYNRNNFVITGISGRTVHADGTVIPFEGKPFDKVVARGKKVRYNVKAFTLPDVQVGSILDIRYSLRYPDKSLHAPEWRVQEELFQKRAYFKFIPFQGRGNVYVLLPHDQIARQIAWSSFMPSEYKPQLHTLPVAENTNKQASTYVDLEIGNVPALIDEPFMPPPDIIRWRVDFYYQVTSKADEYWKDQGRFWSKDVESFLDKKKGVAEQVAKLTLPGDTPEQKAHKLYNFVSKLDNRSYLRRKAAGDAEALGLKPITGAEDVLEQQSANHDDLNRLMVAMMRAAGIPASMMLVPNREREIFAESLLSMTQFSGEIVVANINGKDVFLDPGSKYCPFGLTDWRYSAVQGLREKEGKGIEIAEVPLSNYSQAMLTRLAKLKIDQTGKAQGTLGVAFYGLEAMERRQQGGRTDDDGKKKLLEDEVKHWLPTDSEVHLTSAPDWENSDSPLTGQFQVETPILVNAGRRVLVPLHLFEFNSPAEFAAAQRVNGIYFDYPSRGIDEIHLTLPDGVAIENIPPNDSKKLDYAVYTSEQKPEGNNGIFARRELVMGGMAFPAKVYAELKNFYDTVKADDDLQAVLKQAEHVAGN
jgi:hypothetical protein